MASSTVVNEISVYWHLGVKFSIITVVKKQVLVI